MNEREKTLHQVLEAIDTALLVAQHPVWGEDVSKWECFNDGIKEAHWAVEKLLKKQQ